jgi:hypothetical protein
MHNRFINRLNKEIIETLDKQIIPINNIFMKHIKREKDYGTYIEINDKITLEYPANYPFEKPKVYINGDPYSSTLRTPASVRLHKYLKRTGIDCLCCSTLFCHWQVTNTINTFLTEIAYFNKIKSNVKYHIILEELVRKYPRLPKHEILKFLL